jgi:hypothetical protein
MQSQAASLIVPRAVRIGGGVVAATPSGTTPTGMQLRFFWPTWSGEELDRSNHGRFHHTVAHLTLTLGRARGRSRNGGPWQRADGQRSSLPPEATPLYLPFARGELVGDTGGSGPALRASTCDFCKYQCPGARGNGGDRSALERTWAGSACHVGGRGCFNFAREWSCKSWSKTLLQAPSERRAGGPQAL